MEINIIEGTTAVLTNACNVERDVVFYDGRWWWKATKDNWETEVEPDDISDWISRCVEGSADSSFMGLQFVPHSVPLDNLEDKQLADMLEQRQKDVDAGKIQPTKDDLKDVPPFMRRPMDTHSVAGQALERFNRRKELTESWLNKIAGTDDPRVLLAMFLTGVEEGVFVYTGRYNETVARALITKSKKVLGDDR